MTITSNRLRALGLLLVVFTAGGLAGAAVDRAYFRPVEPRRADGRRVERRGIDADQIPTPLALLSLSPEEERRLHEIARRWRPQAGQALEQMRANVSELENNMFAEMLCAISKEKQERYLAQLQENGAGAILIDKRFRLVRAHQCPGEAAVRSPR